MVGPKVFLIYLYNIFNICVLAMAKAQACRSPSDLINWVASIKQQKFTPCKLKAWTLRSLEMSSTEDLKPALRKKEGGHLFHVGSRSSRTSFYFLKRVSMYVGTYMCKV